MPASPRRPLPDAAKRWRAQSGLACLAEPCLASIRLGTPRNPTQCLPCLANPQAAQPIPDHLAWRASPNQALEPVPSTAIPAVPSHPSRNAATDRHHSPCLPSRTGTGRTLQCNDITSDACPAMQSLARTCLACQSRACRNKPSQGEPKNALHNHACLDQPCFARPNSANPAKPRLPQPDSPRVAHLRLASPA